MDFLTLFLIAIGLAMDAFAVSICKGISIEKYTIKASLIVGIWFALFQCIMPLLGYLLGSKLINYISEIDHYVAFFLLLFIGLTMFLEASRKDENDEEKSNSLGFKTMLILSIATSIDALTVGVTFAFFKVSLLLATILIFVVTFIMSFSGVKIGNVFGSKFKKVALIVGGIILILIGTKILLEHLGVLIF